MGADYPPPVPNNFDAVKATKNFNKSMKALGYNIEMEIPLCPNSGSIIRSGVDDAEESSLKDHMNAELPPLGNFGNQE